MLDEVVQLFDQAVSGRESHARHKLAERLAERPVAAEDRLALFCSLGAREADLRGSAVQSE